MGNPKHRIKGTDGSDHSFRQTIEHRYSDKALYKKRLETLFFGQLVLTAVQSAFVGLAVVSSDTDALLGSALFPQEGAFVLLGLCAITAALKKAAVTPYKIKTGILGLFTLLSLVVGLVLGAVAAVDIQGLVESQTASENPLTVVQVVLVDVTALLYLASFYYGKSLYSVETNPTRRKKR
jgi:hypothetical protein